MVRPFLAGVACMAVVACASSKRPMVAETRAPVAASETRTPVAVASDRGMPGGEPQAEIERLSAEVERARVDANLPEPAPPVAGTMAEPMASVPLSTDSTCHPARTDRCTQSCTLSDSICNNAEKICELAAQLPHDAWAAGKCASAKQTCDAAHTACCGCT